MSCYIHGYTFYLFYRKWKHQTSNQYLNVFLMGVNKVLVLVLVHLIHHPILVLLRLYACLPFFLSSSNRALLSSISSRFRSSTSCLNVVASILYLLSSSIWASLCLASISKRAMLSWSSSLLNSICFNSEFFV